MDHIRNPNTHCIICNKAIYRRPKEIRTNRGNVFCSSKCYGRFNRRESPCIVCGTPILAHFHKKTCSRACANKHRTGIRYKLFLPRKDKVKNERILKLRLLRLRGPSVRSVDTIKLRYYTFITKIEIMGIII